MTKFERRKKREEMRRLEAEENRKDKLKKISEKKPRPANYRKDSNGDIVLFGAIKISKVSWIVLGIIAFIGVYFVIGDMYGETEEYVPPLSFEECELIEHNDPICTTNYKFCRTYADGNALCQFAEKNPFTNVDPNEKKYTDEEQDFLPPSQFILPLISWADARSADEPTCYSQACKEVIPESTNDKQKTAEELNRDVNQLRKDIQIIQDKLIASEKFVQEWDMKEPDYRNKINSSERELEDAEDDFELKKTEYRHAMDVKAKNDDDIQMQKDAQKAYEDASKKLANAQKKYEKSLVEYDQRYEEYLGAQDDVIDYENELKDLLDELALARIQANIIHREHQFVSIILSQSCIRAIENQVPTKCPTYRELKEVFDSTLPEISGEFVDLGYDISRQDPKYKNYWNYYKQLKSWKVITVDPDAEMMKRSAVIEIQPSGFSYLENISSHDKDPSLNVVDEERYIWNDIKITDRCNKAIVAPDMQKITDVINHFLSKCQTEIDTKQTIEHELTDMFIGDSQFYAYQHWLQEAISKCKTKCN